MSGQLLLISDLEGCTLLDPNNPNTPQSTVLCKTATFTAIENFLKKGEKNKVAFLGDFFDKGPFVVESINGIADLLRKYKNRVHIILGNRDVNKLRFIYEFTLTKQNNLSETDFWKPEIINEITTESDIFKKLQLVLKNTMGAVGTGSQINNVLDEKGNNTKTYAGVSSDTYLAYVLLRVFNTDIANKLINTIDDDVDLQGDDVDLQGDDKDFIVKCRLLFNEAKIVHYDSDYKVLLSHAGGFTKAGDFILDNTQYYQDILDKLKEIPAGPENYFSKIFLAQRELKKTWIKPTDTPVGADTREMCDVLAFHNNLLKKSLNFDDVNPTPPDEYFLLQAMGLSGDPNYYSFIASCGLNGDCLMDFNVNPELITKIKSKGIKFVASGHKPHCTTVPLIYQQDGVVFIAADTSNGYRPEDKNKKLILENIPLSFIGNEQNCGVCSLHPKGNLILASDTTNKISALSKDGLIQDYYKDLVKAYTGVTSVPSIEAIKEILAVKVDENSKPVKFQPLTVKNRGGKRRSRKYNKQSKFKKRGGRKTRKFNRKTYKCGLGCRYH